MALAPSTGRPIVKAIALAAFSATTLYLLFDLEVIDFARIRNAFRAHRDLLGLDVLCLLGITAATAARHKLALSTVMTVSWRNVVAANVVSQAVGQWTPGSMAVTELLRVGLLFGGRSRGTTHPQELLAGMALASLFDRVIGLGIMFCVAAFAAFGSLYLAASGDAPARMMALGIAALLLGVALVVLPLSAGTAPMNRLTEKLRLAAATRPLLLRVASTMDSLSNASNAFRGRRFVLLASAALSVCIAVLNPLGCYLTSIALGAPIPPLLLAAILPTLIITVILPTSFAGFGGPQLLAVANFALFGVPAEAVLAMTLVQNTVTLAVQTCLGAAWAGAYGGDIASIVRLRSKS